jgi:predicted transcriptional regulator
VELARWVLALLRQVPRDRAGIPMSLPRDMQRLRAQLLRDSGFVDLEGPSGEGPLSDRGNLHPVSETPDEHARLGQRMEDGRAFNEWAEAVLHETRFPSPRAREAWRLHAEGHSEADIATALTCTRWQVRGYLADTRGRVSKVSKVKRWRNEKRQRLQQMRRLAREAEPDFLMTLAALMLRASASQSQSES